MTTSREPPVGPVERLGWDIGGVHLKVAAVSAGKVVAAAQVPYQIRRGLGVVSDALAALPDWARRPARHAVTMTAELSALFDDRLSGVVALVDWASEHLDGPLAIYGGEAGFLSPEQAADYAADIASANWHATAAFVATQLTDALLVDIGSTTTDLVPIVEGRLAALGTNDGERLAEGELVYTGAVRTPIMALAERLPFAGQEVALVAEHFATIADAHRLAGGLPDGADQQETADGRDKSLAASRSRLARVVGRDAEDAPDEAWDALARHIAELQLRRLHDAAAKLLSRRPGDMPPVLVGCGAGRFIAERLADRLGLAYRDFATLVPIARAGLEHWLSTCGPALAVACLAEEDDA
jgi:(4-(4-[2-(gamma-L-glutamylamino)ethyl]phenoxymethyl)furan-2-yl)methanamine synthase